MENNDLVVQATGLSKAFNSELVVRNIDLKIRRGICFGLLGPNGAGKTTTLRMLLGQSPKTAGELTVLGLPVPESAREIRLRTGVVPQTDNLDNELSVKENLEVYASYFGIDAKKIQDRIMDLLGFVELQDKKDSKIDTLSGGMKRRLSVARSLVNDPELLILDEPTTGLDPQVRHMIWARLRELKQQGKTLLLTTHFMEEAERLCDDLVIMDHGVIICQGHPKDLIKQHVQPEVIEIHGDIDKLDNVLAGYPGLRKETVGETVYCYTEEPAAILETLETHPEFRFIHRPANLEDVFLKLTGRDLRDD